MEKTFIENIVKSKTKKEKFCLSVSVNKETKVDFFNLVEELFPDLTPSKIFNGFLENSVNEMKNNRERILRERKELDSDHQERMNNLSEEIREEKEEVSN